MDEALYVIQNPRLWPDWPFLQVERRTELRPGNAYCLLMADELYQVQPTVYFSENWPPGEWFTPNEERAMAYTSLEELRSNGWKPYYLLVQGGGG